MPKGEKPPSLANCLVDFNEPTLLDPPANPLEEPAKLKQRQRANLGALSPCLELLSGKSKVSSTTALPQHGMSHHLTCSSFDAVFQYGKRRPQAPPSHLPTS